MPHGASSDTRPACLNCAEPLGLEQRFCPQCGQRSDTDRLSLFDMLSDLFNSPLHVERGPLVFARMLLLQPGRVARDYVEGRRRRYFGPFATLATVVGLVALIINATGYQALQRDGLPGTATHILQQHFNLLQLAHLPLQAALAWLVFGATRVSFIEHMVVVAYALASRDALLGFVVVPVSAVLAHAGPTQLESQGFWWFWYAYFGWACAQFHQRAAAWAFAGGVVVAMAEHAAITGLLTGVAPLLARLPGS